MDCAPADKGENGLELRQAIDRALERILAKRDQIGEPSNLQRPEPITLQ